MNASELIAYWAKIGAGMVHPDDRKFVDARSFCLEQIPVPWAGPLKSAKVFTLMLNPVYTDEDKKYELANGEFRKAIRANLSGIVPCYSFQVAFKDYHGHKWARQTYGDDILKTHADSICQINLVAYHSATGDLAKKISAILPTSLAIQRFVQRSLIPRAQSGKIGLVVARSSKCWGVDSDDERQNIVVYKGGENRRAFQTKNTRGGKLIRRVLLSQKGEPDLSVNELVGAQENLAHEDQGASSRSEKQTLIRSQSVPTPSRLRSPFKMRSTDHVKWIAGSRVEASGVRTDSKRYQWLKTMQSVDSFSAAKRIPVMLAGQRIADIDASHVRWAVENGFLIVTGHSN